MTSEVYPVVSKNAVYQDRDPCLVLYQHRAQWSLGDIGKSYPGRSDYKEVEECNDEETDFEQMRQQHFGAGHDAVDGCSRICS